MATKKTAKVAPAAEFYFYCDNDSLYDAVSDSPHSSIVSAMKSAQELHLESGDKESTVYLYKVERLPAKKITTTVTITD